MTKFKRRSLAQWLVIGVLGVFGVGSMVYALSGSSAANNVETCNNCTLVGGKEEKMMGSEEVVLGASGTRFPNGVSADTTSPLPGEMRGQTLTVSTSTVEKITVGGRVLATSTSATSATLQESDLLVNGRLEVTPNVADLTYTLPASSTLTSFLPNAGDRNEIQIYNATTTAGIELIFAAGTGIDLESATSTLRMQPLSTVLLDCMRKVNTDVTCLYKPFVDAD